MGRSTTMVAPGIYSQLQQHLRRQNVQMWKEGFTITERVLGKGTGHQKEIEFYCVGLEGPLVPDLPRVQVIVSQEGAATKVEFKEWPL